MVAVVHGLLGASIGALVSNAPTVVVISFFSHYLLDLVPHIDPETFTKKNLPYSWTQRTVLITDTILTISIVGLFFMTQRQWALMMIGIIASLLPDLLVPLEKYPIMTPFRRLHEIVHWDARHAQRWSWYIAGLAAPALVGIVSTVILYSNS